jgi:diguanylate cyclase (GGDEF)-like protein
MLNVPPSHQVPLLAALTELNEVAYLLTDAQLNVLYLSDKINEFGISSHSIGLPLTSVFPDLEEKRKELESALSGARPLVIPLRGEHDGAAFEALASCRQIDGQSRVLVLFRRLGFALHESTPEQAFFNPQTGLYTRLSMSRRIEEEISRMKRYQQKFSLLLLKFPNAGQKQLHQIADMLRVQLRVMDIVGNYKDGQFLAILPETALENARLTADRLQRALHEGNLDVGGEIQLLYNVAEAIEEENVNALLDRLDDVYPEIPE